jgi:LacI family trehalose operon transcriptional repressor
VLLARDAPGFASVCYDDEGAITLLMQRLYDRGHRHISFLGVPHSDVTTGSAAIRPTSPSVIMTPTAALPGLGMKQGTTPSPAC